MKFLSRLFFFLLLLGNASTTFSQTRFQRLYGGVNQEVSLTAFPAPGGGIYYMGATTSTGSGDADPVIMKLDDNGQVIWARAIGGVNYDVASAMVLATDGGLVCTGSTRSFNGNTLDDVYFFKIDNAGNMQWSKTFSTADLDYASAIIRTVDGGYAMTGYIRGAGFKRVLLIRTDSNGDTLYVRTYGSGVADDQGVELCETPDGGFVITGKTFSQTQGESDIFLLRTNVQGDMLWAKSFGGIHWDESGHILKLHDGNYLISGSTISFGQGDFDILLMKTDTSGNIIWGKTYGGTKSDASYTSFENPDGSIVLSGYTNSMGYGHSLRMRNPAQHKDEISSLDFPSHDRGDDSTNVFLMKTDANGDTIWTRTYGDGAQDEAFHFSKMNDGGYIIPGFSTSYTNATDSTQMMLIRTDSLGHSGCHEQDAHPNIDTTNFVTQTLAFTQVNGITENVVTSNSLVWNVLAEDACLYIQVPENVEEDVFVYPNPASDKFIIHDSQFTMGAAATITVYNMLGMAVQSEVRNQESEIVVNVQGLRSGIYFLKIITSSSTITKKIIIQKN